MRALRKKDLFRNNPAFDLNTGLAFVLGESGGLVTARAGSGVVPTWSRATTSMCPDLEDTSAGGTKTKWNTLLAGELGEWGARRVYNRVATKSEDWTNAAWTKTIGTVTATTLTSTGVNQTCLQTYTHASANWTMRVEMYRLIGSGNIDLTLDGGATWTTVTLSANSQVFSISQNAVTNPQFGIRIVASGDSIYASKIQLQKTDGQTITTVGEYVSVGVTSSPSYHGWGVDGVKNFWTANGNTVASNVVTEAQGAALTTYRGRWFWPAATQLIAATADIRDMTGVNWVKVGAPTVTLTGTGIDGVANSCTRVVANAANTTLLYTYVGAATSKQYSVFIKGVTVTGNIEITEDNGVTWTPVTGLAGKTASRFQIGARLCSRQNGMVLVQL